MPPRRHSMFARRNAVAPLVPPGEEEDSSSPLPAFPPLRGDEEMRFGLRSPIAEDASSSLTYTTAPVAAEASLSGPAVVVSPKASSRPTTPTAAKDSKKTDANRTSPTLSPLAPPSPSVPANQQQSVFHAPAHLPPVNITPRDAAGGGGLPSNRATSVSPTPGKIKGETIASLGAAASNPHAIVSPLKLDTEDHLITSFTEPGTPGTPGQASLLASPIVVGRRNSIQSMRRDIAQRSMGRTPTRPNGEESIPGSIAPGEEMTVMQMPSMKRNPSEPVVVRPSVSDPAGGVEIFSDARSVNSRTGDGGMGAGTVSRRVSVVLGEAMVLEVMTSHAESRSSSSAPSDAKPVQQFAQRALHTLDEEIHDGEAAHHVPSDWKSTMFLSLNALGVVFGDIGTNVLFTIPSVFKGPPEEEEVLGVFSLIIWLLILVVCFKYGVFIMSADNKGNGGCFSLLFLVISNMKNKKYERIFLVIACVGAGLLVGDGVVTPSISILSALEGIAIEAPDLHPAILPLTIVILILLFFGQRFGTHRVGIIFGPIMFMWFLVLGALGLYHLRTAPRILACLNPGRAVKMLTSAQGLDGLSYMGSIVLCVCGAEAMYADLAHFGAKAVRIAWGCVVFPCLILTYLGQGALLLEHPDYYDSPFFKGARGPVFWPILILATFATIIASQALISAAFSLTQQAVQLDYMPPMTILHTSTEVEGQIHVPAVNFLLFALCVILVLGFQSSTALADAYGMAVSMDMLLTSCVFLFVLMYAWKWPRWKAVALICIFLCHDIFFCVASFLKIPSGGYVPLSIAIFIASIMTVWAITNKEVSQRGELGGGNNNIMSTSMNANSIILEDFVTKTVPTLLRPRATSVFLAPWGNGVPVVLTEYIKHTNVLPSRTVLLMMRVHHEPFVPPHMRVQVDNLGHGIYRLLVRSGFMEQDLSLHGLLALAAFHCNFHVDIASSSFWLFHQDIDINSESHFWRRWRLAFFRFMRQNAVSQATRMEFPTICTAVLGVKVLM